MDRIESRARELLADEYAGDGISAYIADMIRAEDLTAVEGRAVRAIGAALRESEEWRRDAERLASERDHARAAFDSAIRHLTSIHAVMKPNRVELPDGRIFEFNNPAIEREMLTALCEYIRAIPAAIDAARKEGA